MENLARAGYLAKGIVYLLIGGLAFQAAAGTGDAVTGPEGALLTILRQPAGRVLLGITAMGLSAYTVWRCFCAMFDPERQGNRAKRLFMRIGYAGSALAHSGLALQAAWGSRRTARTSW